MKNPSHVVALTELEGAALALIARDGPCTPYALKESFRTSPSAFWTGSAGAIYPLAQRMEKEGLVASRPDENDGRSRRVLSVTAKGRKALNAWIGDSERAAQIGFDPLRTRLLFVGLLSPARRQKFMDETRTALAQDVEPPKAGPKHVEALHKAWTKARRDAFETVAAHLDDNTRDAD